MAITVFRTFDLSVGIGSDGEARGGRAGRDRHEADADDVLATGGGAAKREDDSQRNRRDAASRHGEHDRIAGLVSEGVGGGDGHDVLGIADERERPRVQSACVPVGEVAHLQTPGARGRERRRQIDQRKGGRSDDRQATGRRGGRARKWRGTVLESGVDVVTGAGTRSVQRARDEIGACAPGREEQDLELSDERMCELDVGKDVGDESSDPQTVGTLISDANTAAVMPGRGREGVTGSSCRWWSSCTSGGSSARTRRQREGAARKGGFACSPRSATPRRPASETVRNDPSCAPLRALGKLYDASGVESSSSGDHDAGSRDHGASDGTVVLDRSRACLTRSGDSRRAPRSFDVPLMQRPEAEGR